MFITKLIRECRKELYTRLLAMGLFEIEKDSTYGVTISDETIGSIFASVDIDKYTMHGRLSASLGVASKTIYNVGKKVAPHSFTDEFKVVIGTQMGYVMPEKHYKEWMIDSNIECSIAIEELLSAIQDYAIPWMKKYSYFDAIAKSILKRKNVISDYYTLPITYKIIGKDKMAKKFVEKKLRKYEKGPLHIPGYNKSFEEYKIFVENLMAFNFNGV